MNKPAAIYARVSSDRQKENHTIASQTAALVEYAQTHGYSVPPEWVFQDEGYSGAVLVRPGLEALRDLVAEGQIAAALIYSPDRLSRKYAYQVLLGEELSRWVKSVSHNRDAVDANLSNWAWRSCWRFCAICACFSSSWSWASAMSV